MFHREKSRKDNEITAKKDDEIRSKEITIKIIDGLDHEQHYNMAIANKGKERKDQAVIPEVMSMVTSNKKEVKKEVVLGVTYTIEVNKTNEPLIKKQPKTEPKKGEGDQTSEEGYSAQIEFTPTNETNNLEIKVNPK